MIAALVCGGLSSARSARAEACPTANIAPSSHEASLAYTEGRDFAIQHRYPEARGIYTWLLKIDPRDREARLALARLDAWDGCYERAEHKYRALLKEKPTDVEARAGLIDILLWSNRYDDAERAIEEGLKLDTKSADLWRRRAQLAAIRGHRESARVAAELAAGYQPNDEEIRALRDRLYLTQLRVSTRADLYDKSYLPDIFTESLGVLHYFDRFELGADAALLMRVGGTEEVAPDPSAGIPGTTAPASTIIDALYSLSATYHMDGGAAVGLSPAIGAPAKTVPRFIGKAFVALPLGSRFSTFFQYAYWYYPENAYYSEHKQAHIFAPMLGYTLTESITLEARYWASYIVLPQSSGAAKTKLAHAAGGRVMWRLLTALMLGAGYTYGVQLDQTRPPLAFFANDASAVAAGTAGSGFLLLKSHIATVFGDVALRRDLGLTPVLAFEHRQAPHSSALVYSAELGAYLRW